MLVAAAATLATIRPAGAEGTVIERVVAVVDGRPVLLSDVRVLAAVRGLAPQAALEALVDERLMLQAATRLPRAALTPELEARALADLRGRLPNGGADLPEGALRRLARRQATILRYVDLRFRPLVRVEDDSVDAAYDFAWGAAPHPPPRDETLPRLRESLVRAALDRQVEAWIAELRAAADVRYEPGPDAGSS